MGRLFLWGCCLALAGCSYTFNPSSIPGHIKTLEIPQVENETLEVTLSDELTQALIDRFVNDNTLRVVQGNADAVLEATITNYEQRVAGFDANQKADEYVVVVTADLLLRDRVKNSEVWKVDQARGSASYYIGSSGDQVNTEEKARVLAMKQLVDTAISKTVEGW